MNNLNNISVNAFYYEEYEYSTLVVGDGMSLSW